MKQLKNWDKDTWLSSFNYIKSFKCPFNFCDTKKVFTELKNYCENILKKEGIQFSDLFHKLE